MNNLGKSVRGINQNLLGENVDVYIRSVTIDLNSTTTYPLRCRITAKVNPMQIDELWQYIYDEINRIFRE